MTATMSTESGSPHAVWVLLHPLDVVTFRDGRPFTVGVAATGRTTMPRPSTLGGAVQAIFGTNAATNPKRIVGPVLVRTGGSRPRVLLPAPADLVVDEDTGPRRLLPRADPAVAAHTYGDDPASGAGLPAGISTDLASAGTGGPQQLLAGPGDASPALLDASTIERYLEGEVADALADLAVEAAPPLAREVRLGIARHPRAAADGRGRTTVAGLLYQTEFLHPTEPIRPGPSGQLEGIAFAVRVEFEGEVPAQRSTLVRLGGEARQASVTVLPEGPRPAQAER
ncbi:type III-B CRISPR module-associated Cmr3 family protein, partial [Frankia canadensis]|uniref:type III-B CRISPR module-associated Cmr3 family protein n=1 Tax=Frankia canadensis TaxID=1836972 RepID=UPI001A9C93FC